MPENKDGKRKKKKKSFLDKFSRAMGMRRKKRRDNDEDYSSDESNVSASDDDTSSPSNSSRSHTPVPSPRKKKEARENAKRAEELVRRDADAKACGSSAPSNCDTVITTSGSRSIESGASGKPPENNSCSAVATLDAADNAAASVAASAVVVPAAVGSDKYFEAKNLFLHDKLQRELSIVPAQTPDAGNARGNICSGGDGGGGDGSGAAAANDNEDDSAATAATIVTLRDVDKGLYERVNYTEAKMASRLIERLKKSEAGVTDSDSDDWTDESDTETDADNTDFIAAERDELLDYGERYFTTGKYMTYFFLQMERQGYDPSQVYAVIRYYDDDKVKRPSRNRGENSSSGSTSPNIPSSLRRRLLHRRSADNLIANSPTNSMRHSSPESIRSAPVPLKPRSTSHDALSKKKAQQLQQQQHHATSGQSADGASMDSLAKQSLLAAQVLNLIPTHKARERNFLHGRVAANSLLGPVELEKVLPNREIKIFVGTWNMNGQTPPKELNDFMLPSDIQTVPDMLAIGTQESCSERGEWEAALQETLGPSHVLLTSTGLGTLHLALFLRRDLIWFCSLPEDDNFSTRPGTAFRTKGAVALALMLFGTSFLFVTAHLTAHQDKVKERVNDIKRIVRNLELPKDLPTRHKSKDVTQNFDCVFWCGDLNFRLAQPREEVIQWVSDSRFPRESPISLHKDQLRTILNEGAVLRGFEEAPITFPPTYKYDPGTQNFDSSSKQRTPAYTDRILFKGKAAASSRSGCGGGVGGGYIRRVSHESTNSAHKDGSIECLIYDSVPSICTSDHKPVWGVFKTVLRPGIDTIPLAAGMFNREVYLEGIRRRAAAMDDSQSSTRACSIQ